LLKGLYILPMFFLYFFCWCIFAFDDLYFVDLVSVGLVLCQPRFIILLVYNTCGYTCMANWKCVVFTGPPCVAVIILRYSLLCERRILITSKRLGRLTACVHAAAALIYPLHWSAFFHLFILYNPLQVVMMYLPLYTITLFCDTVSPRKCSTLLFTFLFRCVATTSILPQCYWNNLRNKIRKVSMTISMLSNR